MTSNRLEKKLKAKNQSQSRPKIFNLSSKADRLAMEKLIDRGSVLHTNDDYQEQLKEFFEVSNPRLVFSPHFNKNWQTELIRLKNKGSLACQGRWVYFPWSCSLCHILDEQKFFTVRTARNRNLITEQEQKNFYEAAIGIAGLSVGNSAALAIVLQGGAKRIKLADHDRLALSNTNRIRTGITNLGLLKVEMTARQIYEINPYAKVDIFPDGLAEKNIGQFCEGLNVIVDEVDNLAVKYLLRQQAKKRKLPVVMAADNGDGSVVDIERYDLDPKTKFFHGRMGKISYSQLLTLGKRETGRLITRHVGEKNIGRAMKSSLGAIGKTIVSWPQLGGAALISGSAVAYCVRKILNKQKIKTNRAIISLEGKL